MIAIGNVEYHYFADTRRCESHHAGRVHARRDTGNHSMMALDTAVAGRIEATCCARI